MHQLSCNVLLSALSIMPYQAPEVANADADSDLEKERALRMATILGFKVVCPLFPTLQRGCIFFKCITGRWLHWSLCVMGSDYVGECSAFCTPICEPNR